VILQSYHPISLLSNISKVLECLINYKIIDHVSSYNIIEHVQIGFRFNRSSYHAFSNYWCFTWYFHIFSISAITKLMPFTLALVKLDKNSHFHLLLLFIFFVVFGFGSGHTVLYKSDQVILHSHIHREKYQNFLLVRIISNWCAGKIM